MIIWCIILFGLGVSAFFDSLFSYGDVFRQINSILFMLVSLGLAARTVTRMHSGAWEAEESKLRKLEKALHEAQFAQRHASDRPTAESRGVPVKSSHP